MRGISLRTVTECSDCQNPAHSAHRRARSRRDRGGDHCELLHPLRGRRVCSSGGIRCLLFLPGFVVYAGIVYFLFHLYESKWRFASLPDLMNIVRAASVLAVSLLVLDYVLVAPNVLGEFFFGKITIVLYWILQIVFLSGSRMTYRYFRYTRTRHHARSPESNPTLVLGRAADAEVLLRGDRERRRHQDLAGRHPVAVRRRSGTEHPRHSGARQLRCARCRVVNDLAQRGTTIAR